MEIPGDCEVVKVADAQATIAALEQRVKELKQWVQDQSTANLETMRHMDEMQSRAMDAESQLTQRTAECEALQVDNRTYINERHENMKQIEQLQADLAQRTAELEAAKRLATNAQWQIDYVLDEAKKAFYLKGHYTPSDLVDCVLRPAASMLKERDELKAELERVSLLSSHNERRFEMLEEKYKELRTLILTLPKVEGLT